jgi:hypothetical protein
VTADQIRDEAIERAAKAMAALECPGPPDHRHYATAEAMIDALGDMLPTGREFAACWKDGGSTTRWASSDRAFVEEYRHRTFYGEPVTIESLWTHDWQEVPE